MSKGRKKGYALMREIALHEIVGAIRKAGVLSAPEIMSATGRSRGNVDGYLRELEQGGHVLRGLPPVNQRKGATFIYSAPVGEVVELPKREPSVTTITGREHDELTNRVVTGSALPTRFRGSRPEIPPTDYTPIEQRAEAFQASQVVNESRGKPIPMHEQESSPSDSASYDPNGCPVCRNRTRITGAPLPRGTCAEGCSYARERSTTRPWRAGFTHLTKGGDFELRDTGTGKTEIRRVDVAGGHSAPVTLPTRDALAMFVERPASKPKAPPSDEVWVTPVPNTAPVPKPRQRKTGAEDLGHFRQGSKADDPSEQDKVEE